MMSDPIPLSPLTLTIVDPSNTQGDHSQIMAATTGGRGVWKMLTITDKWGRGIKEMLTIADKEGDGVQANADSH